MPDSSIDAQKRQAILQKIRDRRDQGQLAEPLRPAPVLPSVRQQEVAPMPPTPQNSLPLDFLKRMQDWFKAPDFSMDCSDREELEEYRRQLQQQYKTLVALVQMTADEFARVEQRLGELNGVIK
ncbi:hypothetical protein [Gloeobacter kilaueensis]|uniref:Uncharacterized protein n=1 Tax=Gloeobacter kilaueensis (strain ATCC BAA-2537 / CCAP 1431/1 / ULC 316 / JS1) TaxID=1183438 RepID=U5QD13_GLOK1|nr:hypothetical protein [Gloeobacter kilaueensis]AGY56743.1 hypothetical protein GKIL_0497 [Gloeobacter kilaueensis JS1]